MCDDVTPRGVKRGAYVKVVRAGPVLSALGGYSGHKRLTNAYAEEGHSTPRVVGSSPAWHAW